MSHFYVRFYTNDFGGCAGRIHENCRNINLTINYATYVELTQIGTYLTVLNIE